MLLTTAVFLSALGFAAWILGTLFDYTGMAAIGGTIVVVAGASVLTGGLERKTGELRESVDADTTDVSYQYEQVQLADKNRLGLLLMLLGAVQVLRALDVLGDTP